MLGSDLRQLRKSAGMKIVDLAQALEISAETISRYERGVCPIPKKIEYATQWVVSKALAQPSAADRLVVMLREVIGEKASQ